MHDDYLTPTRATDVNRRHPHQEQNKTAESCRIAQTTDFSFSQALQNLKDGYRVRRAGWNGKGMFLYLVRGSTFAVNRHPLLGFYPAGTIVNYLPHIDMKTADGACVPWLASQTDILSDDWEAV